MTSPRYIYQSDGGDHAEHDDIEVVKRVADVVASDTLWQEITDQETGRRLTRVGKGEWAPAN